jgi:hypothetical protein
MNKIYDNLIEYPLPEKTGVRDYIFYFVPGSDKFGKSARYFFNRFYKNHEKHNVNTFEKLIDRLHDRSKPQNVKQIREIIIVTHGTPIGLITPLVNGVSNTNLTEFKYLTAGSLTVLQKDFLAGKFSSFNTKRKAVIAKLTENSWITLRVCNFGQSKSGLYALYSFFGGRANIYAPKTYQFFGTHPILPGMRLENALEVHQHQVKQRFLPKDIHTPTRKDLIVKALANPALFSEPVDLIEVNLTSTSPKRTEYENILDELNSRRIVESLKTKLTDIAEFTISAKARVSVKERDASWVIRDFIKHQNEDFQIEYHLSVKLSLPDATLLVEAHIADMHSAKEFFPIQLFFYESENAQWRGRLFSLAFHTEDPAANPNNKVRFDAVLKLLNANKIKEGSVDLTVLFKDEGEIELSAVPVLNLLSTKGTPNLERKTWSLRSGLEDYRIKLEHPRTSSGIISHTISVYEHRDAKSRLKEEYRLMSYLGEDPDQPGTELMAYLDNFSFDELIEFIRYLRKPYKEKNIIYIHYAIQAYSKKKDYLKRYMALPEVKEVINDPLNITQYDLSLQDVENKSALIYSFEASSFWAEVKVSNPPTEPFQNDLFSEQTLSFTPRELALLNHLEPDSPFNDIEELRQLQSSGIERFLAVEKFTFEPEDPDIEDISCAKFAEIITHLKALQGKSAEEVEAALDAIKIAGDETLSYYLVHTGKSILTAFAFINMIKGSGGIPELVVTAVIKRIPVLGASSAIGAPYLITITRALPYLSIATLIVQMFTNLLGEYAVSLDNWKEVGKRTAIRAWVRKLRSLTFQLKDNFPITVNINIGNDVIELYLEEQRLETMREPIPFIRHKNKMLEGFEEGIKLIEKEVQELLFKSDYIIDQSLYQNGLDACKIKVLRDQGIIDSGKTRALIMRQYADMILKKVPKV